MSRCYISCKKNQYSAIIVVSVFCMTLSLLLGINFSDTVKSGKALLTIFEQEGKFSFPAPVVSTKRNQETISCQHFQALKNMGFFARALSLSLSSKGAWRLIGIQQVQPSSPGQEPCHGSFAGAVQNSLGPFVPQRGYGNSCSPTLELWLSLWVIWGWAFLSSYFYDYGEAKTRKIVIKELLCLQGCRTVY